MITNTMVYYFDATVTDTVSSKTTNEIVYNEQILQNHKKMSFCGIYLTQLLLPVLFYWGGVWFFFLSGTIALLKAIKFELLSS